MRKQILLFTLLLISNFIYSQSGHIMQGIGAVNMSMGGAATAQPLDISGAMQWNPATLSSFDSNEIALSVGAFFSDPTLTSSLPAGMLGPGAPGVSGVTNDDRGTSILPAIAYLWKKEGSKHTFGASAFGISGFGVTFPEEANNPFSATFNPMNNSNPINYPQSAGGFGLIESDYMLLQVGLSYAYKLSNKVSLGIQPNFNYAALELAPNPTASPSQTLGYPTTDKASAFGYGVQLGIFYDSGGLLKLGASYKSKQYFTDFDFSQKYLDGSDAPNVEFNMNYPAIWSVGMGLSGKKLDFALDFRYVDYDSTEGFSESGWQINQDSTSPFFGFPTGAVNGFGWESMTILSAGLQYKITDKLPIRVGYTHNSLPIQDEMAFFSTPATAVIENAMQVGLGYDVSDNLTINAVYHQGFRGDGVQGEILNPMAITPSNPLGAVPGSSVSYDMETSMIQATISYKFL